MTNQPSSLVTGDGLAAWRTNPTWPVDETSLPIFFSFSTPRQKCCDREIITGSLWLTNVIMTYVILSNDKLVPRARVSQSRLIVDRLTLSWKNVENIIKILFLIPVLRTCGSLFYFMCVSNMSVIDAGDNVINPGPREPQIARFMRPTWGPSGSCRPQMSPMLAPWILLSGARKLSEMWRTRQHAEPAPLPLLPSFSWFFSAGLNVTPPKQDRLIIIPECWESGVGGELHNRGPGICFINDVSIAIQIQCNMMTSSNGNIFRVTGPVCGEFTGHRWILHTKASDAEL